MSPAPSPLPRVKQQSAKPSASPRTLTGTPTLTLTGPWTVRVQAAGKVAELTIRPVVEQRVTGEASVLPLYNAQAGGWSRGYKLAPLVAQECTACHALAPTSLRVAAGPDKKALIYIRGQDYEADLAWGTVGRLPGGRIAEGQTVFLRYRYALPRLDTVVLTAAGAIVVRRGVPHPATPVAPALKRGETRLANIWLCGRLPQLTDAQLFPVLVEPPAAPRTPTVTPLLPKTLAKLQAGAPLRILAWGDSVTDGSYLADPATERWQAQFLARLQQRFPQAKLELITEAWGGRNTSSYFAEPPGAAHNYAEKVLAVKPDLVISEFVNDAWLSPAQVEEHYSRIRNDFRAIGAEWIILTPHYVRMDWMGLTAEKHVDDDPRPYVAGLRSFAPKHGIALADAARLYGRLWRRALPYSILMMNGINHPNPEGMALFADSLMGLFGE